jgi:hypothetical protein
LHGSSTCSHAVAGTADFKLTHVILARNIAISLLDFVTALAQGVYDTGSTNQQAYEEIKLEGFTNAPHLNL